MNEKYTHISFLIDESGSMGSLRSQTITTINEFIEKFAKEVSEDDRKVTISIVKFSDEVKKTEVDFTNIEKMDGKFNDYNPSGTTALYDGIHLVIDETGEKLSSMSENERPSKVIVAIVTDGHENASKRPSATEVADKIKHQEETYNWTFMYLGANQDAIVAAGNIGIVAGKAMTYYANAESLAATGNVLYRKMSAMSIMNTDEYNSVVQNKSAVFDLEDRKEVEK